MLTLGVKFRFRQEEGNDLSAGPVKGDEVGSYRNIRRVLSRPELTVVREKAKSRIKTVTEILSVLSSDKTIH